MQQPIYYLRLPEANCEFIYLDKARFSYCEHNHTSVQTITFVLQGQISLKLGANDYTYTKNTYFVIKPYTVHALKAAEQTSILTICLGATFSADKVACLLKNFLEKILPWEKKQFEQKFPLQTILEKLAQNGPNDFTHTCACAGINNFLKQPAEAENTTPNIYLSKFHFIRKCKKVIGLTPHRLLLQKRLRLAQRLLEQQETPANAALAAGFYDQSHFTKAFKALYNVTPAFYQKYCLVKN